MNSNWVAYIYGNLAVFFLISPTYILIVHTKQKEKFFSISVIFFCREFRRQSCDWFYSHVQKRFQNFGSAKVIKSVGFTRKSFLFLNGVCLIYVLLSHIYYHYLKELNEKSITRELGPK